MKTSKECAVEAYTKEWVPGNNCESFQQGNQQDSDIQRPSGLVCHKADAEYLTKPVFNSEAQMRDCSMQSVQVQSL